MTLELPWHVKGVRRDARDRAREAARRSGLPVGEWLDSVIADAAAKAGVTPEALAQRGADGYDDGRDLTEALERIDERIEQLAQEGRASSRAIERKVATVDRTLAELSRERSRVTGGGDLSFFDAAVAEINARQRELDGEPPAGNGFTATPATPAQHSGPDIHDQLRQISDRINELRNAPRPEDSVAALRKDIADISRALGDASPRRALDALESQVRALSTRVDGSAKAGIDGAVIDNITRNLDDIRTTIRTLMPAEGLAGLGETVKALSRKIDQVALGTGNPEVVQQLEQAIASLRTIVVRVASGDALEALAGRVQSLAERIDKSLPDLSRSNEILATLDQRIAGMSDALEAIRRAREPADSANLDGFLKALETRLDSLQDNRGIGTSSLEQSIAALVEKLNVSESSLGNLGAIERNMAELLGYLEDQQAKDAPRSVATPSSVGAGDLADLKRLQAEVERRTQDSLEAVHGTIGDVVDRLALLETGIREPSRPSTEAPPLRLPAAPPPPFAASAPPAMAPPALEIDPLLEPSEPSPPLAPEPPLPSPSVRFAAASAPASPRADAGYPLPPDHPLEPGSGPPRSGTASAAGRLPPGAPVQPPSSLTERMASAKASLDGGRAPATDLSRASAAPSGAAAGASSTNFVLAARRAAQAAVNQQAEAAALATTLPSAGGSLIAKLGRHVKSIIVGASVIAILAGALQLAASYFAVRDSGGEDPKPHSRLFLDLGAGAAYLAQLNPFAAPTDPGMPAGHEPIPPQLLQDEPGSDTAAAQPAAGNEVAPARPIHTPPIMVQQAAPPPVAAIAPAPAIEVTGSIAQPGNMATAAPAATVQAAVTAKPADVAQATAGPARLYSASNLPAGIGGKSLIAAAELGDPAAAFEIGIRLADGRGVPANLEQALVWFERAARSGLVPAQFRLGSAYEKGEGTPRDPVRARDQYLAAALQGHAKAMHNLAVLYAEGVDGRPDYAGAVQWFRRSAQHGLADSQYNLGVLYARGIGVEQNLAESYKWFALAAQQGDGDAGSKRDDVAKRLDPNTLNAATAAVRNWTAQPQPETATTVTAPAGGWDPPGVPATKPKPKSRAMTGAKPATG